LGRLYLVWSKLMLGLLNSGLCFGHGLGFVFRSGIENLLRLAFIRRFIHFFFFFWCSRVSRGRQEFGRWWSQSLCRRCIVKQPPFCFEFQNNRSEWAIDTRSGPSGLDAKDMRRYISWYLKRRVSNDNICFSRVGYLLKTTLWHEHPNCRNKLVFESQKGKIWIQENQVCGIFQAYDESAPSGRFDRKKSSSLCLGQSGSHINELGHDRYSLSQDKT